MERSMMWDIREPRRETSVINALGCCLRNEWSLDAIGPVPADIVRLVNQLEDAVQQRHEQTGKHRISDHAQR
jgi:hypothetical protein